METGIKVQLLPGKQVTVRTVQPDRGNKLFLNEGTGANQLPFILLPIALTPRGDSVLINEPEVHLHPAAQTRLISLLLKIASSEHRQFFMETHSEHVLHALLLAVARGQLANTDLAIYYFTKEGGVTAVRRLTVDEAGRIPGGLPGFFEHSLAELAEFLDAPQVIPGEAHLPARREHPLSRDQGRRRTRESR